MTVPFRYGRTAESPLRISDSSVSLLHAKLEQIDGSWILEDLNSTNGTFVNGERIMRTHVTDGDVVYFGLFRMIFRDGQLTVAENESSTDVVLATDADKERKASNWRLSGTKQLVFAFSFLIVLVVAFVFIRGSFSVAGGGDVDPIAATVLVVAENGAGEVCWTGSGFVVGDGSLIVTNAHVAVPSSGAGYLEQRCNVLKVGYTTDGRKPPSIFREAEVLESSEREDLALLRVEDPIAGVKGLVLQESDSSIGDPISVYGFPALGGETITVSNGVISGFDTSDGTDLIKISANINSGSSGGPVVGKDQLVVGVASAANRAGIECVDSGECFTDGQNMGLARPVDLVVEWLDVWKDK